MLVSVDPGLHHCGVAIWSPSGEMVDARLVSEQPDPAHAFRGMVAAVADHVASHVVQLRAPRALVVEIPQVYRVGKGDPNDLINLTAIVGGLLYALPRGGAPATLYRPREWKGQTPKEITEHRARQKLSPLELTRFREHRKSLAHNVWDAVGLGLHHLKATGVRP